MSEKRKLTFDSLCIEVTRRCNMICPHCYRGNQQNVDIDTAYIDELFANVDIIHSLRITGGEPTLCVDKLEYIIDKLYEYKIPIFDFHLYTNGLIYNDRVVSVIKKYGELVKLCREIGCKGDLLLPQQNVIVEISVDKFHSHKGDVIENLHKYKTALDGFATVAKKAVGNVYYKLGNAKNLPRGIENIGLDQRKKKRIEILDKNHKPLCPQFNSYRLIDPDQVLICCDMYMNCFGNLLTYSLGATEYAIEDDENHIICNCKDDIYTAIEKYNEGKTDCLTLLKWEIENAKRNPFRDLSDKLFILMHKKENDSDIPIVNVSEGRVDLDLFNSIMCINPEVSINNIISAATKKDYSK